MRHKVRGCSECLEDSRRSNRLRERRSIYGQRTATRIVLQNIFSELKEDERRRRELPGGNDRLMSESDAEIGKKMKKSSLTSLRKDNEVKLEENY